MPCSDPVTEPGPGSYGIPQAMPLDTPARIRRALAVMHRWPAGVQAEVVRAARVWGLLPRVTPVGFACELCDCCQAITCLVCDSDACAKCYTCTREDCGNASAKPRPPKSPFARGGPVETPRSAGSGWGDETPAVLTRDYCLPHILISSSLLTASIYGIPQEVVPSDGEQHRPEESG